MPRYDDDSETGGLQHFVADQGIIEQVGEKLQQLVGNGPIRIVQSNYKDVRPDRSQLEDGLACLPV